MNRLFTKIFFWFWFTTIAVVVATAIATLQFNRSIGGDPLRAHFQRTQSAYAQAAGSILDTNGLGGLEVWIGELQGPGGARGNVQLLDDDGEAVFGLAAAHDIRAVLVARGSGMAPPATLKGVFFDPIYGPDGERFWFVSDMRRSAHMGKMFRVQSQTPGIGGVRLAIAVLVSGIVCYGLARYLTTPIRRLQAASAEIANGNFDVRVDDGSRRDELGDLGRDFDRMAAHLERLNASQQQLLRDVSHELRSPLARLQVAVGLARQRGGEVVRSELDRIEREAEALEELIAQLLSVARLESGVTELAQENLELDVLLETIVRDANYESIDGDKVVITSGASRAVICGDGVLLKSALENVVRNALTHNRDASAVEITTKLERSARAVIVVVRDHGDGVAEELISELFKPFVRGEYARDRERGGYGIGLAIADAAIRRHGGQISAHNHPEGGFCVEIILPCRGQQLGCDT